jgi:PAS domain S-box-containing protein
MGLVSRDYKYEAVNEAYCTALSRERSDILGCSISEIFGGDFFKNVIKENIDKCFGNTEILHGAWFMLPVLGKRYMEIAYYPYINQRSQVTHVVFIKRDITERKKREDEIKESQMQLAEAQRIANMGSWEWKLNSDTVWCSEELCNVFGFDPSYPEISFAEFLNHINSKDRQRLHNILINARTTGKPFITEHGIIRNDKANRILQTRGKIVYDETNSASKIIGTSQDITKQELARQAIKASEIKYRRLFETSKEGILLIDASTGIITDINPFIIDFLGFPKENYIGKKLWETEPVKGIKESEKALKAIIKEGYTRYDELDLNTSGSKKVKIEFVSIAYAENTNKMIQCHILDITERKLLQHELNQAAKKRTEDMKKFAHSVQQAQEEERLRISRELHDDVCQRLTAMKFKLNIFEDAVQKNKKINVVKLKSAKKDIDNLIKEVRGISSNLRPTALDHFGMVTALRLLCSESKKLHKININFTSNIPAFNHYDPNIEIALYRIGQEALTNCIKHSRAKKINLEISEKDETIIFTVDDNGKGFDIAKYYELSKSENGHYGLINMRERTEQLAGKFYIESEQRKGTKVKILIPLNKKSL